MHTKDSMIVSTHTQAAVNRLKDYLLTTNFNSAKVELKHDMLFVEFAKGTTPTAEIIQNARNLFYWTDQLTVPHIDGFVHYYSFTNSLLINLVRYEEICSVCEKLKGFGVVLKEFDLSFHEYTFTYDIPGRCNLSYSELLEIEQIINPSEKEVLKHLSVFRMDAFSTLTIKHDSWKN